MSMKLSAYLRTLDEDAREALAKACGTTVPYLYQIAGGHRAGGPMLVRKLDEQTGGKVSRYELRPDVFGDAPNSDKNSEAA